MHARTHERVNLQEECTQENGYQESKTIVVTGIKGAHWSSMPSLSRLPCEGHHLT